MSCGPSKKELLVGTWTGTQFSFEQTSGPDLGDMVRGGEALHIDGKLTLDEAGAYTISAPDNVINGKGKWTLEGNELVMIDEQDNEVVYEILEISASGLTTLHEVAMETPMGNFSGKITLVYAK